MDTIAYNVRTARISKGWTQEQLAEAAGVSQTTIDKIETGKTIRSKFLPYIARALDVDLSEIDPSISYDRKPKFTSFGRELVFADSIKTAKIPLFNYNGTLKKPEVIFPTSPPMMLHAEYAFEDPNSYGVFVATDLMSPELEFGDNAIFDTRYSMIPGLTGIFHHKDQSKHARIVGRLVRQNDTHWIIRFWASEDELALDRQEWPILHRLKVRITRA